MTEEKSGDAENAATPKPAATQEVWVYAGHRTDDDKTVSQLWFALDKDGAVVPDSGKYYKKGTVKGAWVGATYNVWVTREGERCSLFTSGDKMPRYRGRWENNTQVAEWEALHYAAETAVEKKRRFSADSEEKAYKEALEPIVNAMLKTNVAGRRAIKMWVLEYLERHGGC